MSIDVVCSYCKNNFFRETKRYNEAIKFRWKQYCSLNCLLRDKDKRITLICSNISCHKILKRSSRDIPPSGKSFCSKSCTAIFYNAERVKNLPKKYCLNPQCRNEIKRRYKYCSNKCQMALVKFSPEDYQIRIIKRIKTFYLKNKRIPVKREMYGMYGAARKHFKTWNNAIIAAGLQPNPVMFAKKYAANDGHRCDSLAEKIIDDWLYARNILHQRNIPYNSNRMTADFKVKDTIIEFFGLHTQHRRYDALVKKKLNIIYSQKQKFIPIYPTDLFPKSKLSEILRRFAN